jgi:hypothetical protein
MPTTRKDTASVPVKIDIVARDRGWRCGGMVEREVGWQAGGGSCYHIEVLQLVISVNSGLYLQIPTYIWLPKAMQA